MKSFDAHLSDEDLLRTLDGEMPGRRKAATDSHLAACPSCRARQNEIQTAIVEFVQSYRTLDQNLPPVDGPRALLKTRLAALAVPRHTVWHRISRFVPAIPRWVYVTTGMLAATSVIMLQFMTFSVGAASMPDAALTPGLVRSVSKQDICAVNEKDKPAVSASIALEVFEQYRIRPLPRAYEVDYLITPALGGAHDVRNLWPQPYSAGIWNAHVKDALEDHLHNLVCQGVVDLGTAQRDIATNWISAYKKYFQSEQPLPSHIDFQKDPPWE